MRHGSFNLGRREAHPISLSQRLILRHRLTVHSDRLDVVDDHFFGAEHSHRSEQVFLLACELGDVGFELLQLRRRLVFRLKLDFIENLTKLIVELFELIEHFRDFGANPIDDERAIDMNRVPAEVV